MRDLDGVPHHKMTETIVDALCAKTNSSSPLFFRVLVSYQLAKVASAMRAKVKTHARGEIPVNMYALNLASSGFGKGHSLNILEDSVLDQFYDVFMNDTLPAIAEVNLRKLAVQRATTKACDPDEEYERVRAEYDMTGEYLFSFDWGTPAAIKQMRHKLLMSGAGAMCLEIDEFGLNMAKNADLLTLFLEMYDVGKIKANLTKNTADNVRGKAIQGRTPANLMAFGTPSKLLNGGKEEDEIRAWFDTGYGRRFIFGITELDTEVVELTPTELYERSLNSTSDADLQQISDDLGQMADAVNFNKVILMSKDVSILLLEYKQICENLAKKMPDHDDISKAEMSHRYFKALKLAGAYAFVDGTHEITEAQMYSAIKLVEESGTAFAKILNRDRNYVKLAKYIASNKREITHVDLVEDLPFYKGGGAAKTELMQLAIAWGYKNNIIIKRYFSDNIEFIRGESLDETNINEMIISYGTHLAYNYLNEKVPFDQLHNLTQLDGYHWVNHHLIDGHRKGENVMQGFNMVVIDVDGGCQLDTAKFLLKDYKALYYTTKRSTEAANRYRIVMPINYHLNLDEKDFKEFMENIYEWLPFEVDDKTCQRCKKWMSNDGHYEYTEGQLLNALDFIPKTTKNEDRKAAVMDMASMSNMQRWFALRMCEGNRNQHMIQYALMLVDNGKDYDEILSLVMSLNGQIANALPEAELHSTVMKSVGSRLAKR